MGEETGGGPDNAHLVGGFVTWQLRSGLASEGLYFESLTQQLTSLHPSGAAQVSFVDVVFDTSSTWERGRHLICPLQLFDGGGNWWMTS